MGGCASKPKKKHDKYEDNKDEVEAQAKNDKKMKTKAKNTFRHDSDLSSDTDSSDSNTPQGNVTSHKKTKKLKNGGMVVMNTKTIVGGDIINIGEGANIVSVNLGERRRPKSRQSKPSKTKPVYPQPPDFSKLKSKQSDRSTPLPGCFLQLQNMSVKVKDQDVLIKCNESVGKIHSLTTNYCGTGFRVGPNHIMTALHVLDGIRNHEYVEVSHREIHHYIALENNSVYIDFAHMQDGQINDTTKRFRLSRNVVFADPVLDVAIVELQSTDREFPAEFKKFSQALPGKTFFLMGHPGGAGKELNQIDGPFQMTDEFRQEAADWSRRVHGTDGYLGVDNDKKLLFHCSFQQGASGSPGIAVVNGKEAVVVTMLLRGYPEWKYNPNTPPELLAQVGNNQCIEQGVSMFALYQKLHSQNIDLCVSIFGQCDN